MTGQQFPSWSTLPAQGLANPNPLGALAGRDAHAGTAEAVPGAPPGVPVNEMTGYRWTGTGWAEGPLQVDQRFPYFLAHQNSSVSVYSWTDEELTYQWDQEAWRKVGDAAGSNGCTAAYPPAANDPSRYIKSQYPSTDPVPGLHNADDVALQ